MWRSRAHGPMADGRMKWCCIRSGWSPRLPRMANRGFTLLEMIVVVAVMGFLVIGLTEGSRFGLRAYKHQADMIADHDQFDAVDRTLRQLLTQVQMRGGTDAGALSFTGNLPAAVAVGTRRADMDLLVDPDHQLILNW